VGELEVSLASIDLINALLSLGEQAQSELELLVSGEAKSVFGKVRNELLLNGRLGELRDAGRSGVEASP